MKLSGRLFRERTATRVDDTVTFNAPGTFYPQYGKGVFTVSGRGGSGATNSPTGGNTNSGEKKIDYYNFRLRKDGTGEDGEYNSTGPGNWPGNTEPADYCEPYTPDNNSTIYNASRTCYVFYTTPGNTNPVYPGNSNTGASTNIFGVTFPGGVGTTAPVIGDTVVSIPFSNAGHSVTVPAGGYITFKNT